MRDYFQIANILVDIEKGFPVDRLVYKGLHVWPVMRSKIAGDLFWGIPGDPHRNITAYQASGHKSGAAAVLRRLAGKPLQVAVRALEHNQQSLIKRFIKKDSKRCDAVFLSSGFEYTKINGIYYNKFIDPLKELMDSLPCTYLDLEVGFQGNEYEPKYHKTADIRKTIRMTSAMTKLSGKYADGTSVAFFEEFLGYLHDRNMMFDLDHKTLVAQFERILAYCGVYESILSGMAPKVCFVVCYYHDLAMAFVLACKKLKIKTVEIQHSIINKDDWNWTRWTNVPENGYELLPDYFWSWSQKYADLLECWTRRSSTNLVPLIGGNLWFAKWLDLRSTFHTVLPKSLSGKDRTILCTIPFGDQKMINEIIPPALTDAIHRSPNTWKWLIRLHYKSDQQIVNFIKDHLRRWSDRLDVHHAEEYQLYDVFKIADYQVSQTSSTVVEAEVFGVPNIIIGELGKSWFSEEIDGKHYFHAGNADELLRIIGDNVRPFKLSPGPIVTDRDVAARLLKDLVGLS